MKWYAWQCLNGDRAGVLNFAVDDKCCKKAETLIDGLNVGQVISIGLFKPPNSPRHLDSKEDLYFDTDKNQAFRTLLIEVTSENSLICAFAEGRALTLQVPYQLLGSISGGIARSRTHGYYGENTQPIELADQSGNAIETELWFWSCDSDSIFHY